MFKKMDKLTVFHIYDEINKKMYSKFMHIDDKMSQIMVNHENIYVFSPTYLLNNNFYNTYAKEYEINTFFFLKNNNPQII